MAWIEKKKRSGGGVSSCVVWWLGGTWVKGEGFVRSSGTDPLTASAVRRPGPPPHP